MVGLNSRPAHIRKVAEGTCSASPAPGRQYGSVLPASASIRRCRSRMSAGAVKGLIEEGKVRPHGVQPDAAHNLAGQISRNRASEEDHDHSFVGKMHSSHHRISTRRVTVGFIRDKRRIASGSSSSPKTPSSSTSCATSSGSMSIRRRTRSSFPSTRRAKSRRSTERSPACR